MARWTAVPTSDPWTTDVETDEEASAPAAPASVGRRLASLAALALLAVAAVAVAVGSSARREASGCEGSSCIVRADHLDSVLMSKQQLGAARKTLRCYEDGDDGRLIETVVPATYKDPVCAFYKYECKAEDADVGCAPGDSLEVHTYNEAALCVDIKSISYDPDSTQCCDADLCNPGDSEGAATAKSAADKALRCYEDGDDGRLIETVVPATVSDPVCAFYKYKCNAEDVSMGCAPGDALKVHTYNEAALCVDIKSISYDPDSTQCCDTDLCNPGDSEGAIAATSAASKALKCYVNGPHGQVMEMPIPQTDMKGKEPVCMFYKYRCTDADADSGCAAGTIQKVHIFGTADLCDHIKDVSYDPGSTQCCNTNLCNPGDSKES